MKAYMQKIYLDKPILFPKGKFKRLNKSATFRSLFFIRICLLFMTIKSKDLSFDSSIVNEITICANIICV